MRGALGEAGLVLVMTSATIASLSGSTFRASVPSVPSPLETRA
jgi:hypothetical protein